MKLKIVLSGAFILGMTIELLGQVDTLRNFSTSEQLTTYRYNETILGIPEWGYVTGHNIYYDLEWAERYDISDSVRILGVAAQHIGTSTSTTKTITYHIYRPVGSNPKPLIDLASETVTHDKLKLDSSITFVPFTNQLEVDHNIFVSFEIPDYLHDPNVLQTDTLALLSTVDGTRDAGDLTSYGRNLVRFHQSSELPGWNDMYTDMDEHLALHLAIYPVVEWMDFNGLDDPFVGNGQIKMYPSFPNPAKDEANLTFDVATSASIAYELLTLDGKLVIQGGFGKLATGKHQQTIDISELAAGQYILVLLSNGTGVAQSLVVRD